MSMMKVYIEYRVQWNSRIEEEEEEEEESLRIRKPCNHEAEEESEQHQPDIGEYIRGRRKTSQA